MNLNVTVLAGTCSGVPDVRVLPSGRRLASLAVRVADRERRSTSVPVTFWEPPAWVEELAEGDELVVLGRVRRRFFQAEGRRASRVDVEAELVVRGRDRRRRAGALRRARTALDGLEA
ncbi:MAG: single-stranded DNA-binding protein [Acidimicrobiia bacterium]|nr:single-stranded DNA-binding protein [Acidimicrobiia bacterium]